ncbi:hypothetical protein [Paenibacillus chitinolyticus]
MFYLSRTVTSLQAEEQGQKKYAKKTPQQTGAKSLRVELKSVK